MSIFTSQHKKRLIKISIFFVCVLCLFSIFVTPVIAASNPKINYQGKLTDSTGATVADGSYDMEFKLYTQATGGVAVWTETLSGGNAIPVSRGLFSVMLGSTTPLTSVNFNQTLYLGVNIEADGEMSPRKIIGTVPAAFEARRLDGVASSSFVRSDQADTISASTASTLLTITQNGVGDILNLFDGGTKVFSVLDGGNVGIGTSTSARRLTVAGDFRLTGRIYDSLNSPGTNGYILKSTGTGQTWVATSTLGFTTNSAFDTSAELAAILIDETGTAGSLVFSNSPTLTTPNLGTPSTLVGTNITGTASGLTAGNVTTNANLTGAITSAGNAASLGSFTSANLLTAITDETGTGRSVFSIAPAFSGIATFASLTATGTATFATTTQSGRLTLSGSVANIALGSNWLSGDGGDEGVFVSSAGNVGIGTIATLYDLQIKDVNTLNTTLDIGGDANGFDDENGISLTSYSDGNNYIDFKTSSGGKKTFFRTGQGTESGAIRTWMVVDSTSGNIGIGTTTPSRTLTVAGDFRLTGRIYDSLNSPGTNGYILKSTGTGQTWVATSSLGFGSSFSNSAQLAVLLSDETGTGRSVFSISPAFSGTATFSNLTATGTATFATTTQSGRLTLSGSVANIALGSNYLSGDGGDEGVFVSSAGNVGIGTTTPQGRLVIDGTGPTLVGDLGVYPLVLYSSAASNTNNGLSVRQTGNISSALALAIAGPAATGTRLGGPVANSALLFTNIASQQLSRFAIGTSGAVPLQFAVANSVRMTIASSTGNIGIGTTTPSRTLTVAGDFRLTGRIYDSLNSGGTNGQILRSTATGQTWVATSTLGLSSSFTTSAGLVALLSDETGTGNAVFSASPSLTGFTSFGVNQLWCATCTASSTNAAANWLRASKNTVSAFIGDSDSTVAYTQNESSGNLRFNGSGVAWGDFGYYPTGGDAGEFGHFRFSLAASNIDTTPDAKLGVGSLYSAGNVGIGTTTPSRTLTVAGTTLITGALTVANNINISDTNKGYQIGGTRILYASSTNFSTLVGSGAGGSLNTAGLFNTALGYQALLTATSSDGNTAVGYQSLRANTTGYNNTASGYQSLLSNTTGYNNTASGYQSLRANTTGFQNIASGYISLYSNTTGNNNTASGQESLYSNTTGSNNTASGYLSLSSNTTGSNNTTLGYNTGLGITTGINNTILGANVTGLSATLSNNIIIADGAGNRRINVDSSGNVGIGTTTPAVKLHTYTPSGTNSFRIQSGAAQTNSFDLSHDGTSAFLTNNVSGGGMLFSATGAGYLANYTNGSERMRITSSGNVGIGTTSPWSQLSNSNTNRQDQGGTGLGASGLNWRSNSIGYVAGFENAVSGTTFNGVLVKTKDETANSNILNLVSGTSSKFIVNGNGRVGIGTAAPGYALDVSVGATGAYPLSLTSSGKVVRIGALNSTYTHLDTDTTNGFYFFDPITIGGSGHHLLSTPGSTSYLALFSGNLGVGRGSAPLKLSVYSTTTAQALFSGYSSATGLASDSNGEIRLGDNAASQGRIGYDGQTVGRMYVDNSYDSTNGDIHFRTRTAGTPVTGMVIGGNGKVSLSKELQLENTTDSTTGVIYKGANRFLHNYKPSNNAGDNTFMGVNSGNFTMGSTTGPSYLGSYNTGIGVSTLANNTSGYQNTANGYSSLIGNTTGFNNTANGYASLASNSTGNNNTANGLVSLYSNTSGYQNTANGYASLYANTTGYQNTGIGSLNLYQNTIGVSNTGLGYQTLFDNTTGSYNTAIGSFAGFEIRSATGTGANTIVGYNTGRGIITGINNTILGANVIGLSASLSNNIIIADGAGNRRINVDSSGNVGIGTTTPAKNFVVGGARPFLVDTSGVAEVSLRGDSGGWAFRYGARGSANADLGGFGMLGSANTLTSYYIGASQTNPLMTLIQSTGNVGIGTTSPSTKLDVAGGVWTSVAGSARNAAYDLSGGRIAAGLSIYSYGPICTGNNSGICNGTNGVVIGSANTGATVNIPNTGASFFNGGNVGIGTSTPLGLLSVGTGGIADANVPVQIGATSGALTYFGANKGATYGALFGYRNNNSGYTGGEARIIGSESFRILTNDTERLRVTGAGNVGIGTTSTSYRLNVASSSATTYVARITNSDTSNTADGLLISLAVANASRATTNYFVGFSDGAGTVAGKIQGGASAVAYTTTAADLAEYFPVESGNTMPEAGEIVSLDGENGRSVVRATSDTVPFGIVTTNPGFIGNGPICKAKDTRCDERYAEKNALISLVGQVPVKVSNENGDIKMGDSITISSEEGVGMKANFGDTAVGYALEVFDGGGEGQTVMVFANLHTALGMNPDSELLTSLGVDMSEFEEVSVMDRLVELASRFVDGVLTVAGIKTDELCIGDTCVNEAQLIEVLDQIGSTTGGEGNIGEGDDGDESTPSDSVEGGDSGDGTGGGNTEDGDLESVTGDNGGENAPTDPTEGGGNTGGGSGETGA